LDNCDKRSSPKNLRCSAEMHSARNTLCAELSSAYIWIKICRQAGVGILHADISLMQIIIIKNNRLCDNSFADTIWVSFNNAVRDSFSRLSLPSPDVSLDLAPCARSRPFEEPADAIPRFGKRHPAMHAQFSQPTSTIGRTVASCSCFISCQYMVPPFPYFSPHFCFHSFILKHLEDKEN